MVLKGLPQRGNYIPMPALGGQLDDQQIADIANYVRSSWGNNAQTNSTAALVARLRKDTR